MNNITVDLEYQFSPIPRQGRPFSIWMSVPPDFSLKTTLRVLQLSEILLGEGIFGND
jgi:hypothetical protein